VHNRVKEDTKPVRNSPSKPEQPGNVAASVLRSCVRMPYHGQMFELVFEVVQESDGGYCAECLTESIFT
jgi:hypothetical protein